jgi:hypothetical protein
MVERIGDDVRRELERFGPAGHMAELVAAWPALVGDQIARNAWPARFARDGTLLVAASSSAWVFELTQLQEEILGRLRQALGEAAPGGVRFFPGRIPDQPAATADDRPRELPSPTPEQVKQAADLATQIEDENLREIVAKTAAASLARAADGRSV